MARPMSYPMAVVLAMLFLAEESGIRQTLKFNVATMAALQRRGYVYAVTDGPLLLTVEGIRNLQNFTPPAV